MFSISSTFIQDFSGFIVSIMPALASIISAFFAYQAKQHAVEAVDLSKTTHDLVNGQSHALLALTAKAEHAEGMLEAKAQETGKAPPAAVPDSPPPSQPPPSWRTGA